ncbi:hypothetical protein [Lysinibacillus sp. BW-2-10]|uniref:hypothetical protein n=1 Tax=Lysinibacillus sp. BW-2-10 TaxID=2590030 RepID=UPI00117C2AA6|nr:hypothetical protein [Lysinibacillus sp. BW-2-10]TSI11328.1 hypothetical protein FJQ64_00650 [Lysinibacillus sp. BW-2-10]
MASKSINKTVLFISVFGILVITLGHILNSDIIILIGLIIFFALILYCPSPLFLPIMLFYLPWSPVMKMDPGNYTFYTIGVILFFLLFIITKGISGKGIFTLHNLIIGSFFIAYTSTIKLTLGYNFSFDYFMFVLMLVLIPAYLYHVHNAILFETCILFFSIGIITSGFFSKLLVKFPHMLQYINVYEWERVGLTRLSGFYGDANFYSAHILMAVSGLLILAINKNVIYLMKCFLLIFLLIYLGFLSVSKMFLLVLIMVFSMWFLAVYISKGNITSKISILIIFICGIFVILFSNIFSEQINMYMFRFGMVENASSLTTGRSDLLLHYLEYFEENEMLFLLGQGFTGHSAIDRAAHNSIIQAIYQLGVLGCILLVGWLIQLFRITKITKIVVKSKSNLFVLSFAIACFVPWFALDILFFDEFFVIIILFLIGRKYILERI